MIYRHTVGTFKEKGYWKGGEFILTFTGQVFNFSENWIDPDTIDTRDIAHSLSHLARYNGHTNLFYSVAQHSMLVAEKIPGGPEVKLAALLHDAAEAYTGDMSSPLKAYLRSRASTSYLSLQDKITAVVFNKYGVTTIPPDLKKYDSASGLFEAEGFMGIPEAELKRYGFPTELHGLWDPWNPEEYAGKNSDRDFGDVEADFLEMFEDLMEACGRSDLV